MSKQNPPDIAVGLRLSWPIALIGIVVIKAVLSLAVKPGPLVVSYSAISYLLLLLLAMTFAIRNGIQNTLGARPFWVLLATGFGMWATSQFLNLYYAFALDSDVPNTSIADPALFLHVVPLLAAVAILPHRKNGDHQLQRWILNSLLITFVWTFLYGFTVFPDQYLFSSATSYGLRFDILYMLENLTFVAAVFILALRSQPPWRTVYLHLLGASVLYAISSNFANLAIDSGGYVNGKLYGLGLIASVCWFVWVPLCARHMTHAEQSSSSSQERQGLEASVWAMLSVALISIPIVWELLRRDQGSTARTIRLIVAVVAIVCLASTAYIKEYLAKRELIFDVQLANERLRLALKAGSTVAWETDLKRGGTVWLGDLPTTFGILSDTYTAAPEEFLHRVHPDDRQRVSEAVDNARQNRKTYESEFRVVRSDGAIRWLTARGEFYYAPNGTAERMLGVSLDITERKRAEAALRESEERFRSVFRDAGVGMVVVSPEGYFIAANGTFCDYLGYTEKELIGTHVRSVTLPEDWPAFSKKLENALSGEHTFQRFEKRCLHKNGSLVHTENTASLIRSSEGTAQYFVGEVLDVTKRKELEEALSRANQQLIQAQEQERIRIARELHDDISQRLALLAIRLEQLEQDVDVSPRSLHGHVRELQTEVEEVSTSIQNLSHELHSSKLDYLGAVAAMRSWCKEFSEKQRMQIQFESHNVPNYLPPEISLCLFRVLQEALHNAAKHSGVKNFSVRLSEDCGDIHLAIADEGAGFDTEAAMMGRGLGLTSMRERIRLVNGELSIESQPMRGTTIHARVPFNANSQSARATG